MKGIAFKPC
jgi:hypothetical protein